ncbi:16S rRNA (cytosine(967)-C(5))-methyltransferase RsmB [Bowmanella sp. Y26]|uniref:16S rRNA (cytosine(967)-C(5))-methyltransferase RsmB n=1 Tax=Bowmanella yangjiangensis TaxID=2811230 RepID=UPI001BDBD3BB|nr:16S rRNA (cytosine(967)-C(5))-methyltransferase RsmB [Bowmanella yangjiangensis]MBT1063820.1 16S rRNA (cytosine(967)-C(5))-methyltransferase RsmB [Bowmanella yangjiangensis]
MKASTLRADIARTLFQVLEQGHSLRELMPALQAKHKEQDRAWLQEMLYGVLRQLPILQYWLRQLLNKPLKSNQKVIEHLILLGFYQLAFSRVSQHAAVAETVGACQELRCPGLKGLVNACLRNFIRQEMQDKQPDDAQIRSGLPKWLFKKLQQAYPDKLDDLSQAMNSRAPIWLRVNQARVNQSEFCQALDEQGIQYRVPDDKQPALILSKGYDLTQLPGYQQGWFAAQDGAAQQAATLLAVQSKDRVLDACAAPGGKTCHLLELQADIECLALDSDATRLQRVEENLQRLGHHAQVICGDAADPSSWWDGKPFDRILLDAPCSATGVIRRHPDIKWLRKGTDIPPLVELQRRILAAVWSMLKPGGTLLYATCSILPDENREQVKQFLANHPDAVLSPLHAQDSTDNPGWQILPGEGQMDGFYYARLIKS